MIFATGFAGSSPRDHAVWIRTGEARTSADVRARFQACVSCDSKTPNFAGLLWCGFERFKQVMRHNPPKHPTVSGNLFAGNLFTGNLAIEFVAFGASLFHVARSLACRIIAVQFHGGGDLHGGLIHPFGEPRVLLIIPLVHAFLY